MVTGRVLRRLVAGLSARGLAGRGAALGSLLVVIVSACGSDVPAGCEDGDDALFAPDCAAALDERCAAHGDDPSCEAADPVDFGESGSVRCARARAVHFADVAACEVDGITERCFAFVDTTRDETESCDRDQCASEPGLAGSYLTAFEREGLLVRRPCGSSNLTLQGPLDGEEDAVRDCSPDVGSPPAICACAELACAQLR